jgi:hypothetical protein
MKNYVFCRFFVHIPFRHILFGIFFSILQIIETGYESDNLYEI